MGWGRFLLLGDMGQQLDLNDQGETLRRLRHSMARRQSKDADQDAEIAALWQENLNLKLGLASLVRLLVTRGAVRQEEIADIVDVLERTEAPDPHHPFDAVADDVAPASPDLAALGAAAEESRRSGPR